MKINEEHLGISLISDLQALHIPIIFALHLVDVDVPIFQGLRDEDLFSD